jgi:hypothetical protein
MKEKEKIDCPVCHKKFIPRTFYPEEAIFTSLDGKKVSGFSGYMSSSGVKPPEVVLSSWVTYCPSCNYIMKFAKEIVKKEKIQTLRGVPKDVKEKYNSYYFGFAFEDYSQYLGKIAGETINKIEESFKQINMPVWESMYDIEDTFKMLVRFIANLEEYCNIQLGNNNNRDMPTKIKGLKLSQEIQERLLELNKIRDETVRGDYELLSQDQPKINSTIANFILHLIENQITSLLDPKKVEDKCNYIDPNDFTSEVKNFLNEYLKRVFHNDSSVINQVQVFLEKVLGNGRN